MSRQAMDSFFVQSENAMYEAEAEWAIVKKQLKFAIYPFLMENLPKIDSDWWDSCVLSCLSKSQRNWILYGKLTKLSQLDETFLFRILGCNWWKYQRIKTTKDISGQCQLLGAIRNENEHKGQENLPLETWIRAFDAAACVMQAVNGPKDQIDHIHDVHRMLMTQLVSAPNQTAATTRSRKKTVFVAVAVVFVGLLGTFLYSRQPSSSSIPQVEKSGTSKPLTLDWCFKTEIRLNYVDQVNNQKVAAAFADERKKYQETCFNHAFSSTDIQNAKRAIEAKQESITIQIAEEVDRVLASPVETNNSSAETVLLTETQTLLRKLRFHNVQVTGTLDNATKEAIVKLQKENNLVPTGIPSQSFIEFLYWKITSQKLGDSHP